MSFQDEMGEIGRKQQYVFNQAQVEHCADELYAVIQTDLKAEAAAGNYIKFGLFPPRDGVQTQYHCWKAKRAAPETPFIRISMSPSQTTVYFFDWKEVKALVKALKRRGAKDGIEFRSGRLAGDYIYGDDLGSQTGNFIYAAYVMK